MSFPNASFPAVIWDGDTDNPDRNGSQSQVNPDSRDYARIAAEIIATQKELQRVRDLTELEDNTVTSNTTLDSMSELVLVDASAGNVVLTLPAVADADGSVKRVKKTDNSGYTVTLSPSDGSTIDGETSLILQYQWSVAQIQATEDNWYIV